MQIYAFLERSREGGKHFQCRIDRGKVSPLRLHPFLGRGFVELTGARRLKWKDTKRRSDCRKDKRDSIDPESRT